MARVPRALAVPQGQTHQYETQWVFEDGKSGIVRKLSQGIPQMKSLTWRA